jgi:hypothetical protein
MVGERNSAIIYNKSGKDHEEDESARAQRCGNTGSLIKDLRFGDDTDLLAVGEDHLSFQLTETYQAGEEFRLRVS